LIDSDSVPGSRGSVPVKVRPYRRARAKRGALLQKISAADFGLFLGHMFLLSFNRPSIFSPRRSRRFGCFFIINFVLFVAFVVKSLSVLGAGYRRTPRAPVCRALVC